MKKNKLKKAEKRKITKKVRIALLLGGFSGEREVSLKTGTKIAETLKSFKKKYQIIKYDPKFDLKKFIQDAFDNKFDLVFPALHGPLGEDGKIQGLLDLLGIPYLFSGTLASALAMNKYKTKLLVERFGIKTAKSRLIFNWEKKEKDFIEKITREFSLPLVVKPNELGSSVGSSICFNKKDLSFGIKKAFNYCSEVLLEQYIEGRELTVAIMGREDNLIALPVIEIKPKKSFWFDYKAKYEKGASEEICPAPLEKEKTKIIQDLAKKVFLVVGCKDLARADFILDKKDGNFYFLEINTIPGMTETSLAPQAAAAFGLNFASFLEKLIKFNLS